MVWLKVLLWIGVVVLPGGMLLLPVIYAVHRKTAKGGDLPMVTQAA